MNKSAFLKLIQQASNISDQQTEELEKMAVAFPYCQTAHLLLAKSAYDKGSMLSAQRLRRAASYATNRQILKRVIYTSPAEPVFEEAEVQQETLNIQAVSGIEQSEVAKFIEQEYVEADQTPVLESITEEISFKTVQEESESEEFQDAVLVEDETELYSQPQEPVKETDASESELLSLLTINSLSTSFTDLLAQAPDPEVEVSIPLRNTMLAEEINSTTETHPEEAATETATNQIEETVEHKTILFEDDEQAPVIAEQHAEDAQINYAPDEIDRLYAEDALGYWMGSSRMGEQLLLKNEYTRPKPQSFHPELILEYNKTHELEKAIQPAANLLSHQLDIIDQFLKLNPRLKTMANLKIKEEPQEDLSLKSSKIKKSMASENLATIFLKQGKVKKAIKIYEHLILKNPEKKTYFAEQIEKLQNQI